MTVSGSYFGSVSKQQHQNSWTAHLLQEIGRKDIKKEVKMAEKEEGENVKFSLDVELLFAHALVTFSASLFTFAASCVAVHLVRHTCSTKAPPMMRDRTMSYDLCLTAINCREYKAIH